MSGRGLRYTLVHPTADDSLREWVLRHLWFRRCRGCDAPEPHTHHLSWLGQRRWRDADGQEISVDMPIEESVSPVRSTLERAPGDDGFPFGGHVDDERKIIMSKERAPEFRTFFASLGQKKWWYSKDGPARRLWEAEKADRQAVWERETYERLKAKFEAEDRGTGE